MTPEQYEILQEVRDSNIRLEAKFDYVEREQSKHSQSIIDVAKLHLELEKKVDADRNMVKGVLWLGGTGFFATVLGFIYSIFKD